MDRLHVAISGVSRQLVGLNWYTADKAREKSKAKMLLEVRSNCRVVSSVL